MKLSGNRSGKSRRSRDQVFVNGYRFVIASQSDTTIYLKCANFRNKCNARASKRKDTGDTFITKSVHSSGCVYTPNATNDSTFLDSFKLDVKDQKNVFV